MKAWTIRRDVFFPLPQWRDGDGEDVEPIVKVLPKPALADLFLKVSIGRRYDPYIDFDGMGRAQALKLVMLDHPEHLRLHLERQLPDLVQAKSGTMGDLEPADLPGIGPGKGPLLPAEQFALNQIARQGSTVDRDQRPFLSRAHVVDGRSDQLLSRAGLPEDEDRRVRRSDLLRSIENILETITLPENMGELMSLFDLLTEVNPSAPRHKCRRLLWVDPERRFLSPPSKVGLSAVKRVNILGLQLVFHCLDFNHDSPPALLYSCSFITNGLGGE